MYKQSPGCIVSTHLPLLKVYGRRSDAFVIRNYMCVCVWMYTCVCVDVYVCVFIFMYMCVRVCLWMYMCLCVYLKKSRY